MNARSRGTLVSLLALAVMVSALVACQPQPSEVPATVDAVTEVASSTEATADFPRTVDHEAGSTVIESRPVRIAALYGGNDLDNLLALDIIPVVAGDYGRVTGDQPFADYVVDRLEGVEAMASNQPNFERLTAIGPDLIVNSASRLRDNYDTFSAIAPTVAVPRGDAEESLRFVAEAVGEEDLAEARLAEYQQRKQALLDLVAQQPMTDTITFVETDGTSFCVFNTINNAIAIIDELGLSRPDAVKELGETEETRDCADVSPELVGSLDADLMFVFPGPAEMSSQTKEALADNELWQALPAVAAGQVTYVGTHWLVRGSILANEEVMKDLENLVILAR